MVCVLTVFAPTIKMTHVQTDTNCSFMNLLALCIPPKLKPTSTCGSSSVTVWSLKDLVIITVFLPWRRFLFTWRWGKKTSHLINKKNLSRCFILHNLPQTAEILIWVRLRVGPIKRRKQWASVSGMRLRVVCFTFVIIFIITVSSHPPAAASRSDVCLVQTFPPFSTSLLFLISPEGQSVKAALEVRKDVDIISLLAETFPPSAVSLDK